MYIFIYVYMYILIYVYIYIRFWIALRPSYNRDRNGIDIHPQTIDN